MKNKILFILILCLLLSSRGVLASEICSSKGYTILTINGIFTNEDGAIFNRGELERRFSPEYKNESLKFDYLFNPSHSAGIGDLVDVIEQGGFDQKSDYDLVEMLNSASEKVNTQKVLIVGHSQGNFYANSFYDKVVDKEGGIPAESICVYGVANPADRVAGGGKYLTSDKDVVIAKIVDRVKKILPPNTHIDPSKVDILGHDFSKIYLAYQSDKIVSDIKSSLDKLKTNQIQNTDSVCISPQKISLGHKIKGSLIAVADFSADFVKGEIVNVYDTGVYIASSLKNIGLALGKSVNNLLASAIGSTSRNAILATVPLDTSYAEDSSDSNQSEVTGALPGGDIVTTPKDDNKTTEILEPTIPENPKPKLNSGGGGGNSTTEIESDTNLGAPTDPEIIPPVLVDIIPPTITISGNNPEVIVKDSDYVDAGATAMDNVDGDVTSSITKDGTFIDTSTIGKYVITYTATDIKGNTSTKNREIIVADYKYIPKYSFGTNNGDGRDWQVWSFNGSNIYDWSDTYVDNYLREQFKIQTYTGGYWCSRCLQRGIFNHNPQMGFESADLSISSLENNPQNSMNGITYDVVLQWDSTGYKYTISHDSIVDSTGHTDIANVNENMWIGWDDSSNNFRTFPSGDWLDTPAYSPVKRTGGSGMILQPYPVYIIPDTSTGQILSLPNSGLYAGNGIDPTRGRANITPFTFEVIYTDVNNNAPENLKLHIKNTTNNISLPEINMDKAANGENILNDSNYTNGEMYTISDTFEQGDYSYYFTATDKEGNIIKLENNNLRFSTISSTYTYLPQYSFGTNNGDGNNWQVWSFNGSNIYDWSDTYKDKYLREEFKIQAYTGGYWCSRCLERGIFNHDPRKGFELADFSISSLEDNPQNNMNGVIYDVTLQWDALGYTYTISHNSTIDASGHTDVSNMNNNLWVGWDTTPNNFKTFPSGNWQGASSRFPDGKTGGSDMILQPYPIYDPNSVSIPDPTLVLSSEKLITSFNFGSLTPKIIGDIDDANHTIKLTVPYGTEVSDLIPTIVTSDKSTVIPASGSAQDFADQVTYNVKAEDGSTLLYTVNVTSLPNPNPIIPDPEPTPDPISDNSDPIISKYTFNGKEGNITINPLTNNLTLVLTANKKVNWVSAKIEKEGDGTFFRAFRAGASCVNGTKTCTKIWDGLLSSGGLLQDGNYKVHVHIKDASGKEYEDYLPSIITVKLE